MKALVIGGGIAGLVAANELALGGAHVTVHERSTVVGGRASSDAVASTVLNRGPHALYRAGLGLPILERLGVVVRGEVPDLHRFDVVVDDEVLPGPTTPWGTARAPYMSWAEKAAVARFLGALFRLDPADFEATPFGELEERYATTDGARRVVEMMATISTFGRTPRLSAATALRQIRASLSNVLYLEGGWQSLVGQLADLAVARGVTIVTSSRIDDLGTLDADVIVLAVAPDAVERLTGVDFGERRPTRMATLDFVMPTPPQPPRNTFDLDRGVFLSFHPGGVGHCGKYLDPFDEAPAGAARAEIEGLLDLAQPGWRDHVEHQRFLPAMHVNEWFPDAATSGQAGRPSGRLDDRTFLAGDWVGPDGLLGDAAIHSAVIAAHNALRTVGREAA